MERRMAWVGLPLSSNCTNCQSVSGLKRKASHRLSPYAKCFSPCPASLSLNKRAVDPIPTEGRALRILVACALLAWICGAPWHEFCFSWFAARL